MKNIFLIITVSALMSTAVLKAQPALDPTFAGTGYKITNIDPLRDDYARSVLVQPNGAILTGGNSFGIAGYSNLAIAKFKPNGNYVSNFGTNGIASIPGGFFCDMANAANGKIVVAGSGVGPSNNNNYIVYRFTKKGQLDPNFGNNGSVAINIIGSGMICFDAAIQPDNKILLAGYQGGNGGYGNMLIVRLNKNGTLDNTFGSGGFYTLYITGHHSECRQVAVQPDGKIIAAGYINTLILTSYFIYDYAAIRLNTNGTLDSTFGVNGIVREDLGTVDIAQAVSVLSDGRIVLGGASNYYGISKSAALCLLPNGTPDMTFGSNGWKFIDFYGGTSGCYAMASEPDDDIIMVGPANFSGTTGATYSTGLAKIKPSGLLDSTFGIGGIDTFFSGSTAVGMNDVGLQTDGKIVTAGYTLTNNGHQAFLTARFTNSSALFRQVAATPPVSNLLIYPVPVLSNTFQINCDLQSASDVALMVYNLDGRLIHSKAFGIRDAGNFTETITLPDGLPGGIYIVKLMTNTEILTQKIQLIR